MARVYPTQTIAAFPDDIDRDYFGAWLSGLTDGEGCLRLKVYGRSKGNFPSLTAEFCISLRRDDVAVLRMIQSYFACGKLYIDERCYTKGVVNAAPKATFTIKTVGDLHSQVAPHFHRFCLLSKKRNDFLIWERGVALAYSVWKRPMRTSSNCTGRLPKWTREESDEFISLSRDLKAQRVYKRWE